VVCPLVSHNYADAGGGCTQEFCTSKTRSTQASVR
jgi:hypothetical protein